MKRKRQPRNLLIWLLAVVVLMLIFCIVGIFAFPQGLPVTYYAPGLYLANEPLSLYQWHTVSTDGYLFPACALTASDGQTYLTIDPEMTVQCESR